jgi:hypothetical protein
MHNALRVQKPEHGSDDNTGPHSHQPPAPTEAASMEHWVTNIMCWDHRVIW